MQEIASHHHGGWSAADFLKAELYGAAKVLLLGKRSFTGYPSGFEASLNQHREPPLRGWTARSRGVTEPKRKAISRIRYAR